MTFEKIKPIIADKLSIDEDTITMDSSFIEDFGADSLDVVELIMALEEEFDLEISDDEAENMSTVADVVEYIKNHIEE